jgi:hypothetical protein
MSRLCFPALAVLSSAALVGAVVAQQPIPQGRLVLRPPVAAAPNAPEVSPTISDEKALEAAGLKADDPAGLLNYLRQRTLSDTDLTKIQAVIRRLGSDDFEERLKAAKEVETFGPAAIGPLRTASQSDPDFEVLYRAGECLRRMEKVPHAAVAGAVVRALAKAKPPEAAQALLAFLPLADNETVAEEIRATLKTLAVRDGKIEPALVTALGDPLPARRAAAAVAMIEGVAPANAALLADVRPKLAQAAATEQDAETKFQVLYALATVTRDKDAVGRLIELIPDLPRGRLWQVEDYLLQLAGKDAPKATLGKSKDSLGRARTAWKEWWDRAAPGTDLAKFSYTPRIAGKTVLVLMDFRVGTTGMVVELGPDMKERWKIQNLRGPTDAQFFPDGTIAIPEQNTNAVSIRDTAGREVASRTLGGRGNRVFGNPQQVQVLPNGNLLVVCRNLVVEFKKDKDEEVMRYVRNQYDVTAARRLADGSTLVIFQNGPQHAAFLDDKGKEIADRKLAIGMPYFHAHVDEPSPGRVLITELNQVREYDLKEGKPVWTKSVNQPKSVQRLPNGNTLILDSGANRLLEVTPDGEEVWSYTPSNGMVLFRGYRR